MDAVLLRGLPFDEHDRPVAVGERRTPGPKADPTRDPLTLNSAAPQNYLDWARIEVRYTPLDRNRERVADVFQRRGGAAGHH